MLEATIIGNIGADAEIKEFNGRRFASFNVAHSESYVDRNGQKVQDTTWVSVLKPLGESSSLVQYLTKGTQVYVRGSISTKAVLLKNGAWSAVMNMRCHDLQLLGSKNAAPAAPAAQAMNNDNDLPF